MRIQSGIVIFDDTKALLLYLIETSLKDQFLQQWRSKMKTFNKSIDYRIYHTEFKLEQFYTELSDMPLKPSIQFRISNNHLPVETGGWQRQRTNSSSLY